ncbi:MAG: hypothetical protein KH354_06510 [Clostridiales bacterium]|nr:hypothetical protein [Clostridiales bacterium]
MKNIVGLIRKMDGLGRVTIPKELRNIFDLNVHEYAEIYAAEQGIFIRNPAIEIKRIKGLNITVPIPLASDGSYDLEKQREIADRFKQIDEIKRGLINKITQLTSISVVPEITE